MNREPQVGECVVVARNSGDHPCHIGDRLVVTHVDDGDDTIKGIPRGTKVVADYWIPFRDIEPVRYGWRFARQHLPHDLVTLLEACDGIEYIALGREVKESIVDRLPDWKDRVLAAIGKIDSADGEDDEDDD